MSSSSSTQGDKTELVNKQAEDVKLILQDNLKKAIVRGEQLEEIDLKVEIMKEHAKDFEKGAGGLKRMMCMRNCKQTAFVFFVVALIITVIVLSVWKSQS
jgi:hypothetical protein